MSSIGLLLSLALVIHDGLYIQPETASSHLDLYSSNKVIGQCPHYAMEPLNIFLRHCKLSRNTRNE